MYKKIFKVIPILCLFLTCLGCRKGFDKRLVGYWELDKEFIIDNRNFMRSKEYNIILLVNFREDGICTTYSNLGNNGEYEGKCSSPYDEVYRTENNYLWVVNKEEYDTVGLEYRGPDIYEIKKDTLFTWGRAEPMTKMKFIKIDKQKFFDKINSTIQQ